MADFSEYHIQYVTLAPHPDRNSLDDLFRLLDGLEVFERDRMLVCLDKPTTCQKVWNRLLSGLVLDALEAKSDEAQVDATDVQQMLNTASGMAWEKAEPVGEGEEYRAEAGAEVHASALTFHELPVHLSVVAAG